MTKSKWSAALVMLFMVLSFGSTPPLSAAIATGTTVSGPPFSYGLRKAFEFKNTQWSGRCTLSGTRIIFLRPGRARWQSTFSSWSSDWIWSEKFSFFNAKHKVILSQELSSIDSFRRTKLPFHVEFDIPTSVEKATVGISASGSCQRAPRLLRPIKTFGIGNPDDVNGCSLSSLEMTLFQDDTTGQWSASIAADLSGAPGKANVSITLLTPESGTQYAFTLSFAASPSHANSAKQIINPAALSDEDVFVNSWTCAPVPPRTH